MLDLRIARYDDPDAEALTEQAQQFYVEIYGGPDREPLTVEHFSAPDGGFLVGYVDDVAVAMGGWHFTADDSGRRAQIRRMFVAPALRGHGYGRTLLRSLEEDAAAHGATMMILTTGPVQVEAVGLYRAAGYTDIEPFGYYGAHSQAIHLGKPLT